MAETLGCKHLRSQNEPQLWHLTPHCHFTSRAICFNALCTPARQTFNRFHNIFSLCLSPNLADCLRLYSRALNQQVAGRCCSEFLQDHVQVIYEHQSHTRRKTNYVHVTVSFYLKSFGFWGWSVFKLNTLRDGIFPYWWWQCLIIFLCRRSCFFSSLLHNYIAPEGCVRKCSKHQHISIYWY